MNKINYTNSFNSNIINVYKDKGRLWLSQLPKIISRISEKYRLSELKTVHNLSYNYVLSGLQSSQPIILKIGLDIDGLHQEAKALDSFAGFGVIKLLEQENDMLLLERAVSGISLKSYFPTREMQAIKIACDVMQRLHLAPLPKTNRFPNIKDLLSIIDKKSSIQDNYIQKARHLRDHLLSTSLEPVLLHGDLHHDNILQNGYDFLAIDPKGVIGEPVFDVAAFIRNPIPELLDSVHILDIISNRIDVFARILIKDPQRIKDWCFVQTVLAHIWALEDGVDTGYFKQLTEIFYHLT